MSIDFAKRELCSDESCIGVIGNNGQCSECGTPSPSPSPDGSPANDANATPLPSSHEPDDRELCPDNGCIGVIDVDGRCKECGREGQPLDPRERGKKSEEEVAETLEKNRIIGSLPEALGDFGERKLCPDGSCIGLIGMDGACKECGKRL